MWSSSFQLCVNQKFQDWLGEGKAFGNLGCVYVEKGEWVQAKRVLGGALVIFRAAGDKMLEEMTLRRIDMATRALVRLPERRVRKRSKKFNPTCKTTKRDALRDSSGLCENRVFNCICKTQCATRCLQHLLNSFADAMREVYSRHTLGIDEQQTLTFLEKL
jgi:hypothetical protein